MIEFVRTDEQVNTIICAAMMLLNRCGLWPPRGEVEISENHKATLPGPTVRSSSPFPSAITEGQHLTHYHFLHHNPHIGSIALAQLLSLLLYCRKSWEHHREDRLDQRLISGERRPPELLLRLLLPLNDQLSHTQPM